MVNYKWYITIDWSARSKPSPKRPTKDAIWVAEGGTKGKITTHYFRTRQACTDFLERRLLELKNERVLVGWDFCFGYPKPFAKALKLRERPAWSAIWRLLADHIEDDDKNRNNRFAVAGMLNHRAGGPGGPFWGVPRGDSGIFLGPKKDFSYPVPTKAGLLPERRLTERSLRRLQPAWKLYGPGSVGGQSLLGIPRVHYLRHHPGLKEVSAVWPFEGGGADAGARIVHAEIYPSLVPRLNKHPIADRDQVYSYVHWLRERHAAGELKELMDAPWPAGARKRVIRHEGWILGL